VWDSESDAEELEGELAGVCWLLTGHGGDDNSDK
jgi:hypothetical protein